MAYSRSYAIQFAFRIMPASDQLPLRAELYSKPQRLGGAIPPKKGGGGVEEPRGGRVGKGEDAGGKKLVGKNGGIEKGVFYI